MKKVISILIFLIITCCFSQSFSSGFEEYYEQWKKDHNITTEEQYQNLTDKQRKKYAQQEYENYEMSREIESLNNQIKKKDNEIQKLSNEKNIILAIVLGILIVFIISTTSIFVYKKVQNKKE